MNGIHKVVAEPENRISMLIKSSFRSVCKTWVRLPLAPQNLNISTVGNDNGFSSVRLTQGVWCIHVL